jgi:hypothetical protein
MTGQCSASGPTAETITSSPITTPTHHASHVYPNHRHTSHSRRADLHSSQIDDLKDHLVKTKTPRPLTAAIVQGITGWYRNPNYQIPIPRYNPVRPNQVFRKALTDQNAIGWGRMYSGQISQDFQTVDNVDRPRGSHDRQSASELITLLFDQVEAQWKLRNESLHGRDDAEHSLFHRALLCATATRLYAPTRVQSALL